MTSKHHAIIIAIMLAIGLCLGAMCFRTAPRKTWPCPCAEAGRSVDTIQKYGHRRGFMYPCPALKEKQ